MMLQRTVFLLSPARICLFLVLALGTMVTASLNGQGGWVQGLAVLRGASEAHLDQLLLYYAWWPRLAMSLLAGAGLALAGTLLQHMLRNPLASPTTLGVASGAHLALMSATLMAPGLFSVGREWVALGGGAAAMAMVFALAWRRALAPVVLVLSGLVVNIYLGAVATVMLLFNYEALSSQLIWGAGSLVQNGWDGVIFLWPRVIACGLLAWVLLRPLSMLELDDASAKSLGVPIKYLRLAGLGLAVFLTGSVVSVAGIIGFIGLAAPNIVRLAGARRLGRRLLWGTLLGAVLLAVTDQLVQLLSDRSSVVIPTGAVTSALGAPLLLWLIMRVRLRRDRPAGRVQPIGRYATASRRLITLFAVSLVAALCVSVFVGQGGEGWYVLTSGSWDVLQWRIPRTLAALASGLMLATAGTILQRVTGNPIASPEVLGISGGSAIALVIAIFVMPAPSNLMLVAVGIFGAVAALVAVVLLNRSSGFAPERLLLTGVAISALFGAVQGILLVRGDPRGQEVIAWVAGSTYYIDLPAAVFVAILAVVLIVVARPFSRWLDIMPLGTAVSQELGIHLTRSRLALLLLVSLLSACATLIVGPLSFVGLLAPHLARLLGFSRARAHLLGAALVGSLLMVLADWLGRQLLFPWDVPAGVVASLLGGAYFIWGLRRL